MEEYDHDRMGVLYQIKGMVWNDRNGENNNTWQVDSFDWIRFRVCSDVVLPDGDGLELVNKLLLRNPYIGIVLSSGYTDHKSRWQTIQEKGFRFLQKPYTLNRLLHVLRQEVESIPR